jgi:hypothetical protein
MDSRESGRLHRRVLAAIAKRTVGAESLTAPHIAMFSEQLSGRRQ